MHTQAYKHTSHSSSVQMITEPRGALWLHQHKGSCSSIEGSQAFLLLSYSNIILPFGILTSYLQSTPQSPQYSFSLPGQNWALITLFYCSSSLECTTFNPYLSILILNVFLSSSAFLFFPDFQGQTGKTMPLVSVWMWLPTTTAAVALATH